MTDTFARHSVGLESPATRLVAITPDDGADIPFVSRALNASGDGAVRVTTLGGDTATVHLAAGIAFPVRVVRVWATGTTATGLTALF